MSIGRENFCHDCKKKNICRLRQCEFFLCDSCDEKRVTVIRERKKEEENTKRERERNRTKKTSEPSTSTGKTEATVQEVQTEENSEEETCSDKTLLEHGDAISTATTDPEGTEGTCTDETLVNFGDPISQSDSPGNTHAVDMENQGKQSTQSPLPNIVVNELLCYMQNKIQSETRDDIVQVCEDHYSSEAIVMAKNLFFDTAPTKEAKTTRKGANKNKNNLRDIYQEMLTMDPSNPITFVAANIMDLPPIEDISIQGKQLLKEMDSLRSQIQCGQVMKEIQGLRNQIKCISIVQQDVIQLLPPQPDAPRSGAEKENTFAKELKKEMEDLKNQVQCLTLLQKDTAKLLQSKFAEGHGSVSGEMPPLEEIEDSENNNSDVEEENSDKDMEMANMITIDRATDSEDEQTDAQKQTEAREQTDTQKQTEARDSRNERTEVPRQNSTSQNSNQPQKYQGRKQGRKQPARYPRSEEQAWRKQQTKQSILTPKAYSTPNQFPRVQEQERYRNGWLGPGMRNTGQYRRQNEVRFGRGSNSSFNAVPERQRQQSYSNPNRYITGVFISRLNPRTSPPQIATHIYHETGLRVRPEKLNSRYGNYASFYIKVGRRDRDTLMDVDL